MQLLFLPEQGNEGCYFCLAGGGGMVTQMMHILNGALLLKDIQKQNRERYNEISKSN